jgi:hypothetical protein
LTGTEAGRGGGKTMANLYQTNQSKGGQPSNNTLSPVNSLPINDKTIIKGGNLDKLAQLRKRARVKFIQQPKIHALMTLALEKEDIEMYKGYSHTLTCASTITQQGKKLKSSYCNQRWCIVCSRIRTAKHINEYMPEFNKMIDPYFVTLTAPNVKGEALRSEIKKLLATFKSIQETARKRKNPLVGIRKIESTYNIQKDTYHPHLHIIVEGINQAKYILSEWLKKSPISDIKGQKILKADINSLAELFKYSVKEVVKDENNEENESYIDIPSLHVIYKSMRNIRTFQPIGGMKKLKATTEENEEIQLTAQEYELLEPNTDKYVWNMNDWYSMRTGEALSGYQPHASTIRMSNRIKTNKSNPNLYGHNRKKTETSG